MLLTVRVLFNLLGTPLHNDLLWNANLHEDLVRKRIVYAHCAEVADQCVAKA